MASNLVVFGPFEVPYQRLDSGPVKHIGADDVREFWDGPETRAIADKQGCYVFAIRAARGFTPWYVGKATKSMRQECFAYHKIVHYNEVLFQGHRGTPVMFFVAPPGRAKRVRERVINDVETFLIQTAVYKNPDLRNVQGTRVPEWTIKGVARSPKGPRPRNAVKFRKMMGIQ